MHECRVHQGSIVEYLSYAVLDTGAGYWRVFPDYDQLGYNIAAFDFSGAWCPSGASKWRDKQCGSDVCPYNITVSEYVATPTSSPGTAAPTSVGQTAAPSVAPSESLWVLIGANKFCSERKNLAAAGTSVAECGELTLADPACSRVMYSNGDACRCVEAGRDCDFKASQSGNNVYLYPFAPSPPPLVSCPPQVPVRQRPPPWAS